MEPEIRYTQTSDDVSIAYYSMGDGQALVIVSTVLWSHLQLQPVREFYRSRSGLGLGRGLQVVRYDARGTGLSDRNSLDFSMDARLRDLDAVVQRLKLTRLAIVGLNHAAPTAIAYAADHPDRVSHLILVNGYARGRDHRETVRGWESLRDTAGEDWERYTLTIANANAGFSDSASARKAATLYRESMSAASVRALFAAQDAIDVTPLLSRVAARALVMYGHRPGNQGWLEWSRELASKIPDARFVTVAERDDLGWTDEQTRIIEDFLGVNPDAPARAGSDVPSSPARPSLTAIIMFADIADSTGLTEHLGDAAFRAKGRELDRALRAIIGERGGSTIEGKLLGDGVLATFPAASLAIAAALSCGTEGEARGLPLHLGLHAGDVIREDDNVYGGAVNIASRISALSAPGEVLVSRTVADLARTSAGVTFEDRGEHALKGVADAQRLFAVTRE